MGGQRVERVVERAEEVECQLACCERVCARPCWLARGGELKELNGGTNERVESLCERRVVVELGERPGPVLVDPKTHRSRAVERRGRVREERRRSSKLRCCCCCCCWTTLKGVSSSDRHQRPTTRARNRLNPRAYVLGGSEKTGQVAMVGGRC